MEPASPTSDLPDVVVLMQGGYAKVCRVQDWSAPTLQAADNWEELEAEAAAFTRHTRWSPWRVGGAIFYDHCPDDLMARAIFREW
jgi:hypothetical protein